MGYKIFFAQVAVVVATTVGAGMFALPYAVARAGLIPGLFYLIALGVILAFVHMVYFLVLRRVGERRRLVGLVREVLGPFSGTAALIVVVVGQIFTLLVYLILGKTFFELLAPVLGGNAGTVLFWVIASLPLFFGVRRFARAEAWGVGVMGALILLLLFNGNIIEGLSRAPLLNPSQTLFPFGLMFFALAGWTAVEPVYELGIVSNFRRSLMALASGTGLSALLYALFILAILGAPIPITTDTISGFSSPFWRVLLGVLGLFAIWTSYVPVGREAANALADVGWKKSAALLAVVFAPLLLLGAGLSDFIRIAGLVGGVFLAFQYLFIIAVWKKMFKPQGTTRALFWLLTIILGAGAVYELYYFLAQ